jgi:phosphopantothenate synthetase
VRITTSLDGAKLYETERGAMSIRNLTLSASRHVCAGMITADFVAPVIEDGDKLLRQSGRCTFMVDSYDARHTETAFRDGLMDWLREHKGVVRANLLVRSKVLELAATVVNLFVGTPVIEVFSSIDAWERAGREHFPAFRRQPLVWSPPATARSA